LRFAIATNSNNFLKTLQSKVFKKLFEFVAMAKRNNLKFELKAGLMLGF